MKGFTTFIFYIVLPAVFIAFLFWIGWGINFGKSHNFTLKDPLSNNLGIVSAKSLIFQRDLVLFNKEKTEVSVSKIYTDCKCISVTAPVGDYTFGPFSTPIEQNTKPLDIIIPAGGELTLKTFIDLSGSPHGQFSSNIFIESPDSTKPYSIPIKAIIGL